MSVVVVQDKTTMEILGIFEREYDAFKYAELMLTTQQKEVVIRWHDVEKSKNLKTEPVIGTEPIYDRPSIRQQLQQLKEYFFNA